MKVNIPEFERIEKLQSRVRTLLNIPSNIKIDLNVDSSLALNQACRGIADLFPHKKSIATLGALPVPLNQITKEFSKQGYAVQKLQLDIKQNIEEQKKHLLPQIDQLKKDTLFLLASIVEPVTAAIYPLHLVKDIFLNKNIFIIYYQSPTSLVESFRIPDSALECGVFDPLWSREVATTLTLRGERCNFEPLLWSESQINEKNIEVLCEKIKASVKKGYFEERILLDFELKVKNEFPDTVEILPMSTQRVNDRVIFFIKGVNGDALCKEMQMLGFECATADADFWGDPHLNSWLPELGFTVEQAQTSFVMAIECVQKPEAFEKLSSLIRKYQKISGTLTK